MSAQLKRLMQRARLMEEHDENNNGGADDFELKIEGEDEEGEAESKPTETSEEGKPAEDDKPAERVADEDEEEDEDAPAGETEEEKRERRRKERQDRKARQREREESTKRELAALRREKEELNARLAAIEGKDRSREIAMVDETIKRADNAYEHWKSKLAEAMEQHDGAAAAVATEKMLEARDASRQLKSMKEAATKQQSKPAAQPVDPDMQNHAKKFMGELSWYKHGSADADSRIVTMLDNAVAEDGFDPRTPEYWDELRARVKKYLPHRVAGGKVSHVDNKSAPRTQKAVVGGGGGESNGASGGKQVFTLSKERVQALKDAGQWNDPVARDKAIKAYRDFDKANKKG